MTGPVPEPQPRRFEAFFASRGWRFAVLIGLTLLMTVPLMLVSFVIEDRVSYRRSALWEVSNQWGGPIQIVGPVMVLPVEREVRTENKGDFLAERAEVRTERAAPILLLPDLLDVEADGQSEIRERGIFEIPVYTAHLGMSLAYDVARVANVLAEDETVLWEEASLALIMPGTRNFAGRAELTGGGQAHDLEQGALIRNVSTATLPVDQALDAERLSMIS